MLQEKIEHLWVTTDPQIMFIPGIRSVLPCMLNSKPIRNTQNELGSILTSISINTLTVAKMSFLMPDGFFIAACLEVNKMYKFATCFVELQSGCWPILDQILIVSKAGFLLLETFTFSQTRLRCAEPLWLSSSISTDESVRASLTETGPSFSSPSSTTLSCSCGKSFHANTFQINNSFTKWHPAAPFDTNIFCKLLWFMLTNAFRSKT